MDCPNVTITPLSVDTPDTQQGVDLGDAKHEAVVNSLIAQLRQQGGTRYLLTWTGGRIPRGAQIEGHTIAWTRHGIVRNVQGEMIGTYDRLNDGGGESGKERAMIIYMNPKK